MYDVISIGAATVDILAKSKAIKLTDSELILPSSSKNETSASLICSGGGATNSAVAFSRFGLKTACISLIGSDPLSQIILHDLIKNNVVTDFLVQPKNEATDYSIILIASDGSRTILVNRGSSRLELKHFSFSKLKTKWLYLTSLEGNLDLLESLIGFAKENNLKISFNPGNRELTSRRRLISLLPQLDFLLLNQIESEMLTDQKFDSTTTFTTISGYGSKLFAITNGRDGAYVNDSGKTFYSPIINTRPVDETGAGDSFGSAFVAGLIYGHPPETALHWGIKNSASVVSYLGAKAGLLTYRQISSNS